MKFYLQGVEIDTDKPIYVCGRSYAISWFAYGFDNMFRGRDGEESIKQLYVSKLLFQYNSKEDKNEIQKVSAISKNCKYSVLDLSICAFGRSPIKAKEMLEKKYMKYLEEQR